MNNGAKPHRVNAPLAVIHVHVVITRMSRRARVTLLMDSRDVVGYDLSISFTNRVASQHIRFKLDNNYMDSFVAFEEDLKVLTSLFQGCRMLACLSSP